MHSVVAASRAACRRGHSRPGTVPPPQLPRPYAYATHASTRLGFSFYMPALAAAMALDAAMAMAASLALGR